MDEDAKSGGRQTDSFESFTLEPLRLIQTRDFDQSVQVIH